MERNVLFCSSSSVSYRPLLFLYICMSQLAGIVHQNLDEVQCTRTRLICNFCASAWLEEKTTHFLLSSCECYEQDLGKTLCFRCLDIIRDNPILWDRANESSVAIFLTERDVIFQTAKFLFIAFSRESSYYHHQALGVDNKERQCTV